MENIRHGSGSMGRSAISACSTPRKRCMPLMSPPSASFTPLARSKQMTNNEFDSARKQNQGCIVFKLVKDGAERVVAMSKERAKESSTLLPNWTFGALHGSTIHLKGGNS